MEQLRQQGDNHELNNTDQTETRAWAGHDQLPLDGGRWLYVVDGWAWNKGEDVGAWVSADIHRDLAAEWVCEAIGRVGGRGDLWVVDQVGLGDEMVDENYLVAPEVEP